MRRLTIQITFYCGLLILLSACGKKPQPSAQSESGQSSTAISGANPADSISPSPFARPTGSTVLAEPMMLPDDPTAALSSLTQAVRKFSAEHQRVPESLEEVVRAGYVTNMPKPPAGKKFILNPKRLEVSLAGK
ncbi:MAG: hypothetical protein ABIQ35_07945 [Verrucomicrobiota bacterium]